MKINKTVKGIAIGTSLAAFVTLAVPSTSHAGNLLGNKHAVPVGKKKNDEKKKDDAKKKDEKKKDDKKGDDGEGSCGDPLLP